MGSAKYSDPGPGYKAFKRAKLADSTVDPSRSGAPKGSRHFLRSDGLCW